MQLWFSVFVPFFVFSGSQRSTRRPGSRRTSWAQSRKKLVDNLSWSFSLKLDLRFWFGIFKGWSGTRRCTWTSRRTRFWLPWSKGKPWILSVSELGRMGNISDLSFTSSLLGWQGEPGETRSSWIDGFWWDRSSGTQTAHWKTEVMEQTQLYMCLLLNC